MKLSTNKIMNNKDWKEQWDTFTAGKCGCVAADGDDDVGFGAAFFR